MLIQKFTLRHAAANLAFTMQVQINGEVKELPPAATITVMLDALGLSKAACAVEVNKKLVSKKHHAETALQEGDQIEVVTLVGGG